MATPCRAFVAPCGLRWHFRPRSSGARCSVDFSPARRPPDGSLASRLLRLTRPRPVLLARRDLDQKFAVLLMRTSYDVLDGLDIVAMDRFQRAFFERRQTEWSYYLADNVNAVRQGLLTDPRYFDFISFAQLLTITDVMSAPESTFVEAYNAEGDTRVVRRDASVGSEPREILEVFLERVGDRLLERLLELDGYLIERLTQAQGLLQGTEVRVDLQQLAEAVHVLMSRFFLEGFCLEDPKVYVRGADTIVVEFNGPAVLWGAKALSQLRAIPNEYDVWVVEAFLRGYCPDWILKDPVQTIVTETTISRAYKFSKTM